MNSIQSYKQQEIHINYQKILFILLVYKNLCLLPSRGNHRVCWHSVVRWNYYIKKRFLPTSLHFPGKTQIKKFIITNLINNTIQSSAFLKIFFLIYMKLKWPDIILIQSTICWIVSIHHLFNIFSTFYRKTMSFS